MIRISVLLIFLTFHLNALAQYSNDWINFSQEYYKIPVAKDGIYKISYAALQQSGFPVDNVDPVSLQLIHRGKEQAIFIEGQDDNQFNPSDYILFFGKQNDGTLDTGLYDSPDKQPHRYYNLYSDTTTFFLTIGATSGKRMVIHEEDAAGLPSEPYHVGETLLVLGEQYNSAQNISNQIFNSTFDENESWTSQAISQGGSRTFQLTGIVDSDQTGSLPEFEMLLLGRTPFFHYAEIFVGQSQRLLKSVTFTGFEKIVIDEELTWSDITTDGKLDVQIRILNNGFSDQVSVSYIKLLHNQAIDAAGGAEKIFHTVPSNSDAIYLEIQDPPATTDLVYDITDEENVAMIKGSRASSLNVVVPGATSSRTLYLTNVTLTPAKITRMRFRQITPANHDYIIISHPRLRKPYGEYSDPVEAYASYRASETGGNFDTLIVHTQDLYDQFNYGEASPLAIYRFVQFLSVPRPPAYLFLIGKGLEIGHRFQRQSAGHTWNYQDLVPTGGYPGSDMIYSAGINGSQYAGSIPTGRLSAMTPKQVATYLDKIREMEAQPDNQLWKKNILHLSGGLEDGEPEEFRSILESYAAIAEGPLLGAKVTAMAKKSRDLEIVNVADEVNTGVALITFFGHSSTGALDLDIGYVTESVLGYRNKGKYPVLLMNGCEAGAFFLRDTVMAENWVYAKNKGAAAFIAHNSYGLPGTLAEYSGNFYQVAFADSSFFGKGLGDIHNETARRHIDKTGPSIINLSQIQQMILLGDPAIRIFRAVESDLEINESQVSIVPYNGRYVTAESDSFAIKMIVNNYGIARGDTFRIEVERIFPDNTSIFYDSLLRVPFNSDTISFIIRKGFENAGGNNIFHVRLDPDNIIDELSEGNNQASYTLVIPSNGTRNIFPSNFSIVHETGLALSFQATDLFSSKRRFDFEMDTAYTFNSPFLQQTQLEGKVLVGHHVDLLQKDSLVYYWRTRLADPLPGEAEEWAVNSFSFIAGSPEGWGQMDFPQLLDDATPGLVKNEGSRKIEFENSITPVHIVTYGASAGKQAGDVSVKIKNAEYNLTTVNILFRCRQNTMNFIAFDKRTTSPYAGVYLKWYEQFWGQNINACGREPVLINSFASNEVSNGGTRDVIQYVNNVAEGDSVIMFNIGNPFVHLWPEEAKAKLSEIGISIDQLNGISSGEPVVIFGKKGSAPGSALIFKSEDGDPSSAELVVDKTISGGFDSGSVLTPLIGPAQEWDKVVFNTDLHEPNDQQRVDVIGIRLNGTQQTLIENAGDGTDLSAINAVEFPYIQLRLTVADPILLTPVQLSKWLVFFTTVPEGILLPDHSNAPLSLQEGTLWRNSYRFVNLSEKPFADSLHVDLKIFNKNQSETKSSVFKIKAPAPLDTTRFTVTSDTKGLSGVNDIQLFVNPRFEPELIYDNNVIRLNDYLTVSRDQSAPFIDVTVDGRHLLNNDFVSSDPHFAITTWDENPFYFKADTTGMRIFLTYPCDAEPCQPRSIWFHSAEVEWEPATAESNFLIDFRPTDLEAGNYQFRVEATDASGNPADPYTISFQVGEEESFSIIHPYPNPSDGHVTFGFEIPAGELPASFMISITDLNGKPVFSAEMDSGFHIGKNRFDWDGTDSNGNQLRAGVYLYTLKALENGTPAVAHGKLVLLR